MTRVRVQAAENKHTVCVGGYSTGTVLVLEVGPGLLNTLSGFGSRLGLGGLGFIDPDPWRLSRHCNNTITTEKNSVAARMCFVGDTQSGTQTPFPGEFPRETLLLTKDTAHFFLFCCYFTLKCTSSQEFGLTL